MLLDRMPRSPDVAPKPYPYIGHLPTFLADPLGFLVRMARTGGDAVRIPLGIRTLVLLSHPRHVKRVLRDDADKVTKLTPVYRAMGTILGKGILTTEGDHWLAHRRIVQPAFHKQKVLGHVEGMRRAAEKTAEGWANAATRDGAIDVFEDMSALTLQIVTETLLGSRSSDDMHDLGDATEFFHHYAQGAVARPVPIPLWVPTPLHVRHKVALARLDRVAYRLIDEKLTSGLRGTDVLSLLVDARYEDGRSLPREQVRDEVLTLLAAGHDTTANLLSWTFHLLSLHPGVRARLREELVRVLGERPVVGDDLPKLTYTRYVVNESLRLYPPAWTTARLAKVPLDFDGVRANEGDVVMVSPWVTHRREDFFPNPEGFDPSRWEREAELPAFAFFPFGGGAHKCIGDTFAMQEAMLVLGTLCRRFELDAIPGARVVPEPLVTLRPKGGLPMHVRMIS